MRRQISTAVLSFWGQRKPTRVQVAIVSARDGCNRCNGWAFGILTKCGLDGIASVSASSLTLTNKSKREFNIFEPRVASKKCENRGRHFLRKRRGLRSVTNGLSQGVSTEFTRRRPAAKSRPLSSSSAQRTRPANHHTAQSKKETRTAVEGFFLSLPWGFRSAVVQTPPTTKKKKKRKNEDNKGQESADRPCLQIRT